MINILRPTRDQCLEVVKAASEPARLAVAKSDPNMAETVQMVINDERPDAYNLLLTVMAIFDLTGIQFEAER